MINTTTEFIQKCLICQQMKPLNKKKARLLMPILIPSKVWHDLSIDFITHFPKVQEKSMQPVVVDNISKYAHCGALMPLW